MTKAIAIVVPVKGSVDVQNAAKYLSITAPSNYKDPAKIADYIIEKRTTILNDIKEDPANYLHICDCRFKVCIYTDEDDLNEHLVNSKNDLYKTIHALVSQVDPLSTEESVSSIVVLGPRAGQIVRAIRRQQLQEEGLTAVIPVEAFEAQSYLISSESLNSISDAAMTASLGTNSFYDVNFYQKFIDTFIVDIMSE